MKCPYCTTSNRETRCFCCHCGLSLGWSCSRCRFFNLIGEDYCGGCGVPRGEVAEPAAHPEKRPARAPATGRSAIIRDEITTYLQSRKDESPAEAEPKRVSQDDIDSLFQS